MPTSDPNNFELVKWAWGILAAPILYLFKAVSGHKQHVAEKYVSKDDFREDMRGIKGDLKTIIDKLDRKADK